MNKQYVIILYIRISVEDDDMRTDGKNESNSVANQRDLLRAYVENQPEFRDCQIIELCDDGYSGTNMNRPSMTKLLEKVKAKEVDCVIVKDFSRFGRDYLVVSDYVDQIFPFLGIRFISLGDGYDSARMNGKTSGVDIAFCNVIYGYYSRDLSLKVKSGKLTKAKNGDFLSPFAPIGYRKDKKDKNRLVIEPETADIVRRIFCMAGMGISVRQITHLFNAEKIPTPSQLQNQRGNYHKWWSGIEGIDIWNDSMVLRILRDERYLGKVIYGKRHRPEVGNRKTLKSRKEDWIVVENKHEAIISEEEFDMAQANLKEYVKKEYVQAADHLFTGKLRCGSCGYALARRSGLTPQYYCDTKYRRDDCGCMEGHIKESEIAEAVLSAIHVFIELLLDEKVLGVKKKTNDRFVKRKAQLDVFKSAYGKFSEQKFELFEEKASGKLSTQQYIKAQENISRQQEDVAQQVERLTEEIADIQRKQEILKESRLSLVEYLQVDMITRQMVIDFVECIYVYGDKKLCIQWEFDEMR